MSQPVPHQAREVFESTLDEISDALLRGEPVKLRAFGVFSVRSKRERVGRNPRTGVEAPIVARRVMTFKPSPTLNAKINGLVLESPTSIDRRVSPDASGRNLEPFAIQWNRNLRRREAISFPAVRF